MKMAEQMQRIISFVKTYPSADGLLDEVGHEITRIFVKRRVDFSRVRLVLDNVHLGQVHRLHQRLWILGQGVKEVAVVLLLALWVAGGPLT